MIWIQLIFVWHVLVCIMNTKFPWKLLSNSGTEYGGNRQRHEFIVWIFLLWDVMPCSMLDNQQLFGGARCLQLQGKKITRWHIPEGSCVHIHRYKSLKYHFLCWMCANLIYVIHNIKVNYVYFSYGLVGRVMNNSVQWKEISWPVQYVSKWRHCTVDFVMTKIPRKDNKYCPFFKERW